MLMFPNIFHEVLYHTGSKPSDSYGFWDMVAEALFHRMWSDFLAAIYNFLQVWNELSHFPVNDSKRVRFNWLSIFDFENITLFEDIALFWKQFKQLASAIDKRKRESWSHCLSSCNSRKKICVFFAFLMPTNVSVLKRAAAFERLSILFAMTYH